jgi:hypothetical protein
VQAEDGLSVRLASSLPSYKAVNLVIPFSFDRYSKNNLLSPAIKESSYPTEQHITMRLSNQYDNAEVLPTLKAEIVARCEIRGRCLIVDRTATEGNSPTHF